MVRNFVSQKYGNIKYDENIWTGKRNVEINGVSLKKEKKSVFSTVIEDERIKAIVAGNIYKGATLNIGDENFLIYSKTIWYEYILAVLPLILILIWGNNVQLCSIIPVVGGAIGGGISGALSFLSLTVMKTQKKPLIKVLVGIIFFIITFATCAAIGTAIVSAFQQAQ